MTYYVPCNGAMPTWLANAYMVFIKDTKAKPEQDSIITTLFEVMNDLDLEYDSDMNLKYVAFSNKDEATMFMLRWS